MATSEEIIVPSQRDTGENIHPEYQQPQFDEVDFEEQWMEIPGDQ
jgi:hypothetical protein